MKPRVEITHVFSLEQCMRCHNLVGCPIVAPGTQAQDGQGCDVDWMASGLAAVDEEQNSSTAAGPNARHEQDI